MTSKTTYPEHEKLKALGGKSQVVGDFLVWLEEQGFVICEPTGNQVDNLWVPLGASLEWLLAEHFEIDPEKLETEKRQMLDELRAANSTP